MSMSNVLSFFMLAIFVAGLLLLGMWNQSGLFASTAKVLQQASESRWTLRQFLNLNLNRPKSRNKFLFTEESVVSVGYRYNGRFDAAVLHWEEVPILDAIIERKFPISYIPNKPKQEDFFQAGLYALAMMEKGISCSTTKLVLIYCKQDNAQSCIQKDKAKCLTCSNAKIFERKFKPKPILQRLRKLDGYWYRNRPPKASPTPSKCRSCPYGIDHSCDYSAV